MIGERKEGEMCMCRLRTPVSDGELSERTQRDARGRNTAAVAAVVARAERGASSPTVALT